MAFNSEKFYRDYHNAHYYCPNCGSRNFSSTLVGYVLNPEHPEQYKDRNSVKCYNCGWKGIYHDLAPKPEINDFKETLKKVTGIYYSEELADDLLDMARKIYDK